jgi:hypothetical protein
LSHEYLKKAAKSTMAAGYFWEMTRSADGLVRFYPPEKRNRKHVILERAPLCAVKPAFALHFRYVLHKLSPLFPGLS